ncbi:hypothetical protein C8Q76DRAFT_692418 [Earliella scabrosa]|nr:hypothetical protein C8Q76DRAFT_692418 [Earliella scabrosa]
MTRRSSSYEVRLTKCPMRDFWVYFQTHVAELPSPSKVFMQIRGSGTWWTSDGNEDYSRKKKHGYDVRSEKGRPPGPPAYRLRHARRVPRGLLESGSELKDDEERALQNDEGASIGARDELRYGRVKELLGRPEGVSSPDSARRKWKEKEGADGEHSAEMTRRAKVARNRRKADAKVQDISQIPEYDHDDEPDVFNYAVVFGVLDAIDTRHCHVQRDTSSEELGVPLGTIGCLLRTLAESASTPRPVHQRRTPPARYHLVIASGIAHLGRDQISFAPGWQYVKAIVTDTDTERNEMVQRLLSFKAFVDDLVQAVFVDAVSTPPHRSNQRTKSTSAIRHGNSIAWDVVGGGGGAGRCREPQLYAAAGVGRWRAFAEARQWDGAPWAKDRSSWHSGWDVRSLSSMSRPASVDGAPGPIQDGASGRADVRLLGEGTTIVRQRVQGDVVMSGGLPWGRRWQLFSEMALLG